MTVLIGKNGSGKSSTLHALFGAPQGYTCSDFWFSTDVDPIAESGDRNRYFYGYIENKDSDIKEVMKLRMKRGSETKKEDLDYWETSRPLMKDGMLQSKRNSPVNKDVIYLDFRAEVSAFDKIFTFVFTFSDTKKSLLRLSISASERSNCDLFSSTNRIISSKQIKKFSELKNSFNFASTIGYCLKISSTCEVFARSGIWK